MKYATCDEFENWLVKSLEKHEVDEKELENYEPSNEEIEEVEAFVEIMSKIVYNYGRLEGLAASAIEFGGVGISLIKQEYSQIQQEIDTGVEVLERYFARIETELEKENENEDDEGRVSGNV